MKRYENQEKKRKADYLDFSNEVHGMSMNFIFSGWNRDIEKKSGYEWISYLKCEYKSGDGYSISIASEKNPLELTKNEMREKLLQACDSMSLYLQSEIEKETRLETA